MEIASLAERQAQALSRVMSGGMDEGCLTCRRWTPIEPTRPPTTPIRYGDCANGYGITCEEQRCDRWYPVRVTPDPPRPIVG
jgi:hypothetical protein